METTVMQRLRQAIQFHKVDLEADRVRYNEERIY